MVHLPAKWITGDVWLNALGWCATKCGQKGNGDTKKYTVLITTLGQMFGIDVKSYSTKPTGQTSRPEWTIKRYKVDYHTLSLLPITLLQLVVLCFVRIV